MKAIIAKKTNKQIQKTWFSVVEIPLFFLGSYACNKLIKILLKYNQERIQCNS